MATAAVAAALKTAAGVAAEATKAASACSRRGQVLLQTLQTLLLRMLLTQMMGLPN